jgi:hypothetical protein
MRGGRLALVVAATALAGLTVFLVAATVLLATNQKNGAARPHPLVAATLKVPIPRSVAAALVRKPHPVVTVTTIIAVPQPSQGFTLGPIESAISALGALVGTIVAIIGLRSRPPAPAPAPAAKPGQ